jgi:hypothetical protein
MDGSSTPEIFPIRLICVDTGKEKKKNFEMSSTLETIKQICTYFRWSCVARNSQWASSVTSSLTLNIVSGIFLGKKVKRKKTTMGSKWIQ